MKKLILLSALLIFACSSDDSTSDDNSDDNNDELLNCESVPYPSIVYGEQEWTVENACHITYRDGTTIQQITAANNNDWLYCQETFTPAWCYVDDDPSKPILYNWYAVMGIYNEASFYDFDLRKNLARDGWHVPSMEEWGTLVEFLVANGYGEGSANGFTYPYSNQLLNTLGKSMASSTGWTPTQSAGTVGYNQSTNNSSGFNAFPFGHRWSEGFIANANYAFFWSSSVYNETLPWTGVAMNVYLAVNEQGLAVSSDVMSRGNSVRFVKDQ